MVEGHICLESPCGIQTHAVVFHFVERRLMVYLRQTLRIDIVLQNTEKQNPGGASAPPCTCLRAPLVLNEIRFNIHLVRSIPSVSFFLSCQPLAPSASLLPIPMCVGP